MTTERSRRRGALLGLAIGDALGAAVEFQPRGSFAPVTGYRGGGPHGIGPGEWTDDTSMALALADSLAASGMDLADQGRRYIAWWKKGTYSVNGHCFDIGNATRDALVRIVSGETIGGSTADGTSGNGSIMRLAPVAIRYAKLYPSRIHELADHAAKSSMTTHASEKCLSACRYLAVVLAALIEGVDRDEVLAPDWPGLAELQRETPLHPDVLAVAKGSFRTKADIDIRGSGYVVLSLEAALWAFARSSSFAEAVLAAVNLGDDSDTTGAVCGQLSGAFFGADAIPASLLDGLAKQDWLEVAVERLETTTVERFPLAGEGDVPPATRSYWVVPGRLLAGAYPESPSPNEHGKRIGALWKAGIRTFVSLMEPHERSPSDEALATYASAVTALATATGEPATCLRFPIVDVSTTTPEKMRVILDTVDHVLDERSGGVYVHCLGGVGRTGTVIGCWLLRHGLASGGDVLHVLAKLRRADVERASVMSPETEPQRTMVRGWSG